MGGTKSAIAEAIDTSIIRRSREPSQCRAHSATTCTGNPSVAS